MNAIGADPVKFPNGEPSHAKLYGYVKNIKISHCPSAPKYTGSDAGFFGDVWGCQYGVVAIWNGAYVTDTEKAIMGAMTAFGPDDMPSVAKTIMLCETRSGSMDYYKQYGMGGDKVAHYKPWDNPQWPYTAPTMDRHSSGANYAFADGHVKWYKKEQAEKFFLGKAGDGVGLTLAAQEAQEARAWWHM